MKNVITLSLFLALLSGCAFAHPTTKHHDPYYCEYEEYYVVYPSSKYIVVLDSTWHSHNGGHLHSHYHYNKYHEHKKKYYKKKHKKIYKKKYYKKKYKKKHKKYKKYKKYKKKKYSHHH